jgi:hypothetical protein
MKLELTDDDVNTLKDFYNERSMETGSDDLVIPALLRDRAAMTAEIERLNTRHVANIKARDEARKQADEANAESAKLRKQLDDLRYHLQVPQGAVRLDAWKYEGQLIVCGDPVETDVDDPLAHNCDAMGCGSCSHIVIRERLNELGTLAVRDEVERLRTVAQVAAKGADGR